MPDILAGRVAVITGSGRGQGLAAALRFAAAAGAADAVVERLFADYFVRGLDIGDRDVLNAAARDCGLGDVAGWLAGDDGAEAVRGEIDQARDMGVQGVPFFIFAGRLGVPGAQEPSVLRRAMAQARQAMDGPADEARAGF